MFNTDSSEQDLFELGAKLAGCAPVDLLKVRTDPQGLVVILATGQKFIFDPSVLGANIDVAIRAQLANVLGVDPPPAPAPIADPAPAKPKPVRTTTAKGK